MSEWNEEETTEIQGAILLIASWLETEDALGLTMVEIRRRIRGLAASESAAHERLRMREAVRSMRSLPTSKREDSPKL